jgi:hypothetical protein
MSALLAESELRETPIRAKMAQLNQRGANMLRSLCLIALAAVVLSSTAFAADDAPSQTGAFLSYCKTNDAGCTGKISDMYTAMLIIVSTNPAGRTWCPAKQAVDIKVLAPKVVGWLSAHPEANSKPTNDGIQMAVTALYPCKR